jgi:DnaT DNA-binding domain
MPEKMEVDTDHPVQLDSGDLNAILNYIARLRALKVGLDSKGKHASLQPTRDELKALVNAKRALRRVPTPPAERGEAPAPTPPTVDDRALPDLSEFYGNHRVIPEDWRPAPRTAQWAIHYLQTEGVAFDMAWLVAEFVSYWRSRAKAMASWQQAFRNNILMKHGRGVPLAPTRQSGPRSGGAGSGNGRVFDSNAELRRQRLDDFDDEARNLGRSRPDRP